MDGFYVAKLKKFSNVTLKLKNADDAEESFIVEDSQEENTNETLTISDDSKKVKSVSPEAVKTSEDLKDKEGTTGKKKRRKKKKKIPNTRELDMSSSTQEDRTMTETDTDEKIKKGKKRKLQQEPGEGDESSPPKVKHSGMTPTEGSPPMSQSKKRRLRRQQKKLEALNKSPSALEMSNNVKSPVKNAVSESTHDDLSASVNKGSASVSKGPTVTASKLSKSAKRRLKKKMKALEGGGQEVVNLTVQSDAAVGEKKKKRRKKKKKHSLDNGNVVDSEMSQNSSPSKKLKVGDEENNIGKTIESHSPKESGDGVKLIKKIPLGKKKRKKLFKQTST